MDALIVVDMQVGLLAGAPIYELPEVIDRIKSLSGKVRSEAERSYGLGTAAAPTMDSSGIRLDGSFFQI